MNLPPKTRKLIDNRIKSGKYRNAKDVIVAAVSMLESQESFGDFVSGELDSLLGEGERDLSRGNVFDGEEVFAELRRMSDKRRGVRK